jgi:hypothetical protein
MIHPTIETLRRLRLTGMAKALEPGPGDAVDRGDQFPGKTASRYSAHGPARAGASALSERHRTPVGAVHPLEIGVREDRLNRRRLARCDNKSGVQG